MDSPGMTQAFGALLVATHRPATPKPDMPDEVPETVQSPSVSTMVPYIPYQSSLQQTAPSIISAITSFSTSDSFVIESPTGLYWFRRYDVPERPQAAFLSRIPFSFFFQEQGPDLAQGSLNPATSKLPRFDFADYPVKFDEILGNGGEGVVVAATIRGKRYALKIFYMDKWRVDWKPRDFSYHLGHHPFGRECIAFARIHHHHLDGAFTPKCYGWMRIVPHEVRTAFFPYRCGLLLRLGGYAIVKEYIPVTPKEEHVKAIIEGIQGLHDIGITVNDCRPCNYRGSKLVDLGHAFVDFEGDCYRRTAEDYLDSNMKDVMKQNWEC
ncbi:hypothetical protein XPA_006859 [Xanthoria parietina]